MAKPNWYSQGGNASKFTLLFNAKYQENPLSQATVGKISEEHDSLKSFIRIVRPLVLNEDQKWNIAFPLNEHSNLSTVSLVYNHATFGRFLKSKKSF